MYSADLTAALVHEHQADLLREAAQRRLARSAGAPSRAGRNTGGTGRTWWRRLLLPATTPLTVAGPTSRPA
jgi:hypothetical protein